MGIKTMIITMVVKEVDDHIGEDIVITVVAEGVEIGTMTDMNITHQMMEESMVHTKAMGEDQTGDPEIR